MSDYKSVSRNDVNVVVSKIETLAKELRLKLSAGDKIEADPGKSPILSISSEIVRNSSVLAFSLGELTATELGTKTGSVVVTPVTASTFSAKQPSQVRLNYHNKRDTRGRFSSV